MISCHLELRKVKILLTTQFVHFLQYEEEFLKKIQYVILVVLLIAMSCEASQNFSHL